MSTTDTAVKAGNLFVVCLTGRAQSGKSTGKALLVDELNTAGQTSQGFSLAEPLRTIASTLFRWDGDKTLHEEGDRGRKLLINVGMKMREIRPTVWVDFMARRINGWAPWDPKTRIAVVDDLRFENEVRTLKAAFPGRVLVLRLHRSDEARIDSESEAGINDSMVDAEVENDGDKDALRYALLGHVEAFVKKGGA